MNICFVGTSHAPKTLAAAAMSKGFYLTNHLEGADLVFVSEDSPVADNGERDLSGIEKMVRDAHVRCRLDAPLVLTSQVTPGFTRSLGIHPIYHMAETLRIKDAMERALNPEQIILGCREPSAPLPKALETYCEAFKCPVHKMAFEAAEFAKIAINMFLAAQVDCTNRLSLAAARVGANWEDVRKVLSCDKRIGPEAYLTPGRWQDSKHLLRDAYWLEGLGRYGPDQ